LSSQFITNEEELLTDVIADILPTTESVSMLVGYFYFSGFEEIYQNIKDKNVRILVGMDIEKDITNKLKEFEVLQAVNVSREMVKKNYFHSLVKLFNDTDFFDSTDKQEAFKIFISKIRDGSLEIRKTLHPNHAKLYLFTKKTEASEGGRYPGVLITGSSNLSKSGLRKQNEINVVFRDEYFQEGEELFNKLWEESVEIASLNNVDEFLNEVYEKLWIDKIPKPFLMYIRALEEYFAIPRESSMKFPSEITQDDHIDLKYQTDALFEAKEKLERHNGVIIADVVGMGKSIIASALAYNLKMNVIIIAPPHLTKQWDDYRYMYNYNARVYSSGKIDRALDEQLQSDEKLIIVDEAHKYRNDDTEAYALLHELCQGNKVALLTATPFNNRPQDIFSMIKLFQIPSKSTIQTVDNLAHQFRQLIIEYKSIQKSQKEKSEDDSSLDIRIRNLADQIRDILRPVIIRRSRIDLMEIEEYRKDLENQGIQLPEVKDPIESVYDLGDLSELYLKTLEKIHPQNSDSGGFIGARYKPTFYLKDFQKYRDKIRSEFGDENLFRQSQINLALFMRRLLVHRFESSVDAFRLSLNSMIKSTEYIRDWYEKFEKVPIYKKGNLPDIDQLIHADGEDIVNMIEENDFDSQLEKFYEKGLQIIEKKELKKAFIEDIYKDIELLTKIREQWFGANNKIDPKLEGLKKTLSSQLKNDPTRKILLFTEYADTASYIFSQLKDDYRVFKYSSIDSTKTNKEKILKNFDASLKSKDQENDFDILVATDAISEGFNLHRAGTVFNYDIPYNPTKVIQRVGRINRIERKVFDELYIYNFFPTATGEDETRVKQISTLKIAMIHALLGEDTKVLTAEEDPASFFKDEIKKMLESQEEKSWDVGHRNFLNMVKNKYPEMLQEAMEIPKRTRISRTVKKDETGALLFGKKGKDYRFMLGKTSDECIPLTADRGLSLFSAEITEKSEKTSEEFNPIYQFAKENLFITKTQVPYERSKADSIMKLELLIKNLPNYSDYLKDLLFVVKEYDGLPGFHLKKIRNIEEKAIEEGVVALRESISPSYLTKIIQKANSIDEAEESLILAEELI